MISVLPASATNSSSPIFTWKHRVQECACFHVKLALMLLAIHQFLALQPLGLIVPPSPLHDGSGTNTFNVRSQVNTNLLSLSCVPFQHAGMSQHRVQREASSYCWEVLTAHSVPTAEAPAALNLQAEINGPDLSQMLSPLIASWSQTFCSVVGYAAPCWESSNAKVALVALKYAIR